MFVATALAVGLVPKLAWDYCKLDGQHAYREVATSCLCLRADAKVLQ